MMERVDHMLLPAKGSFQQPFSFDEMRKAKPTSNVFYKTKLDMITT